MSLEKKIAALLEQKQKLEEKLTLPASNPAPGEGPIAQGSSQQPEIDEIDETQPGVDVAAKAKQEQSPVMQGDANSVSIPAMESVEDDGHSALIHRATNKDTGGGGDNHVATVLKTGSKSDRYHAVSGSHKYRVAKEVNGKYLGTEHDFHTDDKEAAIAHAKDHITKQGKALHTESTIASLKEQVKGLFEGVENVSDEFVSKAAGIFEAAVIARTNDEMIKLTEQLEAKAEAELEALRGTLAEQVDKYVGYVVESWMKENQVAIDAGLRTEIAESFMLGLKNMFQENFIQVPEDKVDVLEKVTGELTEARAAQDRLMEQNAALLAQKNALERAAVLESASKELTAIDADRLVRLIEGVDFESKELFEEKVKMIREAHFKKTSKKSAETILEEGITGVDSSVSQSGTKLDPTMAAYVSTLSKTGSGFTS